jgi:hypothetical protein
MAIEIPRSLVEFVLLGPEDDRRQLQDSPILGDVWIEFARRPGERLELLIAPFKDHTAATVASALSDCPGIGDADIAYLQGIVAARLSFDEVIRFVVPMSGWWNERRIAAAIGEYTAKPAKMATDIQFVLEAAAKWVRGESGGTMRDLSAGKRYVVLAGVILWARDQLPPPAAAEPATPREEMVRVLQRIVPAQVSAALRKAFDTLHKPKGKNLIWTVSLNRTASPALTRSVPAVKADAARTLFAVDCSRIVWAVVDSGIDATHRAFADREAPAYRVQKSFDFTTIREIVSLDNARDAAKRRERVRRLLERPLKHSPDAAGADECLRELAEGARKGRSIDWSLVERLVEIDPAKSVPPSNHGTHVAGIIGADKEGARTQAEEARARREGDRRATAGRRRRARQPAPAAEPRGEDVETGDWADGMCPDIRLYDFRVLAPTLRETEFAIIAALQYIRYVNERHNRITIHGANLSLSIPHDVRNYACGRTPVCNECERLVDSGVVVVAAAGNHGYQSFQTQEGLYASYAAFSITDPGNADGVITVGATHRYSPHTYGVSFFSSRGPTGDGRIKPDLVAPGERIRAPLPGDEWGDLDGTSMAAPHVSGAAAMLMARYSELIGQPRRIKRILCESATDLGREKSFQGNGMLDVLRAFQAI